MPYRTAILHRCAEVLGTILPGEPGLPSLQPRHEDYIVGAIKTTLERAYGAPCNRIPIEERRKILKACADSLGLGALDLSNAEFRFHEKDMPGFAERTGTSRGTTAAQR